MTPLSRLIPAVLLLPLLSATVATVAAAEPSPGGGPSPCAPYDQVAALLRERYREAPVARMLSDRGFVIEVLAAADGSSVTVLGISPPGPGGAAAGSQACILATGSAFTFVTGAGSAVPGSST